MKKFLKTTFLIGSLLLGCWACMEIHPLLPPEDPPKSSTICKASPIEQNIIGTWHFESTYNFDRSTNPNTVTFGTVTFDAQLSINDPNSLFESQILDTPVDIKRYNPKLVSTFSNYSGTLFTVYTTSKRGTQIDYFTVVSNECNKIHMRQHQSGNNVIGFILTR